MAVPEDAFLFACMVRGIGSAVVWIFISWTVALHGLGELVAVCVVAVCVGRCCGLRVLASVAGCCGPHCRARGLDLLQSAAPFVAQCADHYRVLQGLLQDA